MWWWLLGGGGVAIALFAWCICRAGGRADDIMEGFYRHEGDDDLTDWLPKRTPGFRQWERALGPEEVQALFEDCSELAELLRVEAKLTAAEPNDLAVKTLLISVRARIAELRDHKNYSGGMEWRVTVGGGDDDH